MSKLTRTTWASLPAAAFLLVGPAVSTASANVLVVDAAGAGAYTAIQPAVDAAVDGDVLLVRTGNYAGFVVADKSLTVLGDTGAHVTVSGGTRVRDLASTRTVALVNVDFSGVFGTLDTAVGLTFTDNAGHVRVQRSDILAAASPTGAAVSVVACADVAFGGCDMRGSTRPGYCAPAGGPGLVVTANSTVTLYACVLHGADGLDGNCNCDGGWGGDASTVLQSNLFASNSSFVGGKGGDVAPSSLFSAPRAGDGGNGIKATTGTVRLLACVTTGGYAGNENLSPCGMYSLSGASGLARAGSTFIDVAGTARTLAAPATVHAGVTENLTVRGSPGDLVGLLSAPTTDATYVPAWHGVLFVPLRPAPQATRLLYLGFIPASGALDFSLPIQALAPGEASRSTYIQALLLDSQGQRYLSSARILTTLP